MPEKTSGKTSKAMKLPNVKNNKNTASKKKTLAGKNSGASTAKASTSKASTSKASTSKASTAKASTAKASTAKDKRKENQNELKEKVPVFMEDNNKSNDTPIGDLNADKPSSKPAEKIFSDLDGGNASYLEPYGEDILFLTDRHKSLVTDVISCLKSNTPFCFLGSKTTSYHEYYKEIIIDHIKIKEKIELLYFDPKFGDDLSVIINKELKNVDISLIGSLNSSISRKILVIDNENFANDLDWELFDSLRLELKVVNIGVFGITPAVLDEKIRSTSAVSNFKTFYLPDIKKSELKELDEYVSNHSYKTKHLETLSSLFMNGSGKGLSGRNASSGERSGFWHKFREYITRK